MHTNFSNLCCRSKVALLVLLVLPTLAACKDQIAMEGKGTVNEPPRKGAHVGLSLTGFNYTNRYIDQFSADGQGGGNLYVSTPSGGGGGSVCCVSYFIGQSAWKAKIRWQSGACTYNNRIDTDGKRLYEIYSYFKEVDVLVDPAIPKDPKYFEVHFYPDGHVEAAIAETGSRPRLVLNKEREDNSLFKQCQNDKKPKE